MAAFSMTGRTGWSGSWRPTVLLLVLLGYSYGYQEQRFAREPEDQVAIAGHQVILPCRVEDKTGALQWTQNDFGLGTNRNLSGYDRYSMIGSDKEGDFSLKIQNVTLEDDGNYQCQVSYGLCGEPAIRSRYAKLTVLIAPNPPRIVQGSFIDATEKQPVDIECVSLGGKPAAKITWVDGNQAVIKKNVKTSVELLPDGQTFKTRSILRLTPSKAHHKQTITCQAQNKADNAARMVTVYVEVKYAPKVKLSICSGDVDGRLPEGSEAGLRCEVDANPKAEVYRWYVNNSLVVGDYTGKMIIFNVTRKYHNAVVKCEVINSVGKSEETITLDVTYPPVFRTRPRNVGADEGSSISLYCDVDGQPKPEIKWVLCESGRIAQPKGSEPTLNIKKVNKFTAGRYVCIAKVEGYNEIRSEATVFIKGPPNIISNRTQFGSEGEMVKIECVFLSVPKSFDIIWYFEGREIKSTENPDYATLEEDMGNGIVKASLVISVSQSKHYGLYNCSVTNDIGNANVGISLKPKKTLSLFFVLMGVTLGIIVIFAFIIVLVICNRSVVWQLATFSV